MKLISNKHKQAKLSDHDSRPTPFMKNVTARQLRRSQLETEVDRAAESNATPGSQDRMQVEQLSEMESMSSERPPNP